MVPSIAGSVAWQSYAVCHGISQRRIPLPGSRARSPPAWNMRRCSRPAMEHTAAAVYAPRPPSLRHAGAPVDASRQAPLWTDDFSSLTGVLRLRSPSQPPQ